MQQNKLWNSNVRNFKWAQVGLNLPLFSYTFLIKNRLYRCCVSSITLQLTHKIVGHSYHKTPSLDQLHFGNIYLCKVVTVANNQNRPNTTSRVSNHGCSSLWNWTLLKCKYHSKKKKKNGNSQLFFEQIPIKVKNKDCSLVCWLWTRAFCLND